MKNEAETLTLYFLFSKNMILNILEVYTISISPQSSCSKSLLFNGFLLPQENLNFIPHDSRIYANFSWTGLFDEQFFFEKYTSFYRRYNNFYTYFSSPSQYTDDIGKKIIDNRYVLFFYEKINNFEFSWRIKNAPATLKKKFFPLRVPPYF